MGNFNNFMFAKTIDQLAERCVREQLPIVEFVQWYEEEGQYLDEQSFFGDVGRHAASWGGYGAGAGALSGLGAIPLGLGGAALGGLYGGAKNLINRYSQPRPGYNTTKQQAVDALSKFAQMSPRHARQLNAIVRYLGRIQPSPEEQPQQKQQPAMDMSKLSGAGQVTPAAPAARSYNPGMGMAQGIA
jgi:hypothetical protein